MSKKEFTGMVVSDRMNKTRVVAIDKLVKHPIYKKYIRHRTRLKIHDEKNESRAGDTVRIIECRPISRDKHFRLLRILKKAL